MGLNDKQGLTRASLFILTMLFLIGGPDPILNGQAFSIVPLGFTDAEHTRNDGVHTSSVFWLNSYGHVSGTSKRYNGAASTFDRTAWVYDGVTTKQVGLVDSSHLFFHGLLGLNDSGHAIGTTARSGPAFGSSAWYFDGNTTFNIGYDDAEHVASDGYRNSAPKYGEITNSGLVLGTSDRFNSGTVDMGLTAWVYDNQTALRSNIGITDSLHTRNDRYRESWGSNMNTAGQVVGESKLYDGQTTEVGRTAWIYDNGVRTVIGFNDAEHTNSNGFQFSSVEFGPTELNESGQAIGSSKRYTATGTNIGQSAWRYSQGTTTRIGLFDSDHTKADGTQISEARIIHENGMVIGNSNRYAGGTLGQSSWRFDGSTTVRIGLVDAEHTNGLGTQHGVALRINSSGEAAGQSERYISGLWAGTSAWYNDGLTTKKVGLVDGVHIRSDGMKTASIGGLTDSGIVWGSSIRYDGMTNAGQTSWIFDSNTDDLYPILLSERVTDNFALSSISHMEEDGTAFGYYRLFDSMSGTLLGERAFVFTFADGARDFADVYGTELSASGWEYLSSVAAKNDAGMFMGVGSYGYDSLNNLGYLIVPSSVPEPSSSFVFLVAIAGVLSRRNSRPK